jgi:hypothetical protein
VEGGRRELREIETIRGLDQVWVNEFKSFLFVLLMDSTCLMNNATDCRRLL